MAQLKDLIVNGPSRFIGDVYATTFTGNLAGNATSATSASSAGNASTVAGLSVHSGRNNEANKIVRTDGNGYLQVGYINSSSGWSENNNSSPDRVWGSNASDSYLRAYRTSALSVGYATNAGTAVKVGNALTVTLNGGTTEGTNKFTYDGSGVKSLNITPSIIGAANASHTHNYIPITGGVEGEVEVYSIMERTLIGNPDNNSYVVIREDMCGPDADNQLWLIETGGGAIFESIAGKLVSSLAIKLNGGTTEGTNLFTFNNSASKTINITPSAIGAAAASHTHNYLPLAGGTMSNTNVVTNLNADLLDGLHAASFYQRKSLRSDQNSIYDLRFNYGTYDKGDYGGTYNGEYPTNYGAYLALTYNDKNIGALMFFDAPTNNVLGHIYVRTRGAGDSNTTYSEWGTLAYLTDNVASSSKWANARTITLTGSVTGSVSIDGSQNVSLATTTNHTHNYAGSSSAGGSANSALTLLYNNKFDTIYGSYAIFQQSSNISDFPHDGWFNSIKMLHNNSSGYFTEIAMSFTGEDGMWRRALLGGTQAGWYKMLDSGNYNSYAPKLDGTGATGTWGISISGNAATATDADTLDGVHYQNILERRKSGSATSGTATGWFRIAETLVTNTEGTTFLLAIERDYYSTNNESYLFSISINYSGGISITQLSGYANSRLITKIRVDWTNSQKAYIDLYIASSTANNSYFWYTVGCAKSYTAWTANPTLVGTAYEFTTVQGCKSDRGFTGDLTGNASSATKLATSRTIWGQSFDGTGNVSGALSGVTDITASGTLKLTFSDARYLTINGGGIDFHTYNSGWATGYNLNDTNNSLIGVIAGGYGNGNTLKYYYYGGIYSSPKMVILPSGNVGIGTTTPSYKLHIAGVAYASEGLVSDGPVKVNESFVVDGTNGSWYGQLNIADDVYILGENTNINFIESLNIKQHNPIDKTHTSIASIDNSGNITLNVMNDNGGSYEISTRSGALGIGIPSNDPNIVKTPSFLMSNRGYIYLNASLPSSPNYPLVVNGTIQCTTLSQTSDIKYKSNIKQIEYEEALKIIENLNPVTWDWNENTVETGSSSGFVAQEAEEFIPNAISRDNENNLSLDYTQLHSYEIRVIQEQQKEIIKLKEKLKILENLIS